MSIHGADRRRFQRHYRLPETGEPDDLVLKKLKSISAL
jgi:hypothetical protein